MEFEEDLPGAGHPGAAGRNKVVAWTHWRNFQVTAVLGEDHTGGVRVVSPYGASEGQFELRIIPAVKTDTMCFALMEMAAEVLKVDPVFLQIQTAHDPDAAAPTGKRQWGLAKLKFTLGHTGPG